MNDSFWAMNDEQLQFYVEELAGALEVCERHHINSGGLRDELNAARNALQKRREPKDYAVVASCKVKGISSAIVAVEALRSLIDNSEIAEDFLLEEIKEAPTI